MIIIKRNKQALLVKLFVFISICYCAISYSADKKTVYKYTSAGNVTAFSDRPPLGLHYTQIIVGCYACEVNSRVDWHNTKLYLSEFRPHISQAALTYGVDPAFVRAIIHAESHFDQRAISKQGAQGLMQLMPKTAQSLGVKNAFVAKDNIYGGVKHLAYLLKKYHGDKELVAAAYNAGEGAVRKFGGIPPYEETKVYVERVDILHQRYQRAIKI